MKYLTAGKAAEKWNVSLRRIQQMCSSGEIKGAYKQGRSWMIPEDASVSFKTVRKAHKKSLPLPVGISSYTEAVSNYYYVDKTLLIRDFIDALPKVSLFARPRRFGKTLNMDMLRVFFEKTDDDTSIWFKDKAIWKCGEYYRAFQGKYPVIFLTFKDVKYDNWINAYQDITEIIRQEYTRHSCLENSDRCSEYDKNLYRRIVDGKANEIEFARSLSTLSAMLRKHFDMPAVIIIDEYDTPIEQGRSAGYYDEVIRFVRNLFSGAFKDNPSLAYGFLTGILRVAKESIFSGMNNLKVNTIMDDRFSSYFGFTEKEVADMLSYYGMQDKLSEAKEWYDGYRFGTSEVYNPWSVINYVDEHCCPKAFWQSTGSNDIITEIIRKASPDITESLRSLLQGNEISTYVDTSVIYPEILINPSGVYSFLLMAGYLKITDRKVQNDGNYICNVSIPNKEILIVYQKEIISRMSAPETESTAALIQQALAEHNAGLLSKGISDYLKQTVSYFDTANESFYQGLMLGLVAMLNDRFTIRSNRESGDGRYDIQMSPKTNDLPGILMELKAVKNASKAELAVTAQEALNQIDVKHYDTELKSQGVRTVCRYGAAFSGKNIEIVLQTDSLFE